MAPSRDMMMMIMIIGLEEDKGTCNEKEEARTTMEAGTR